AYRVEDTRVGQTTDLDRLTLRVWTDGSIEPRAALDIAVETLRNQLTVFSGNGAIEDDEMPPVMTIPTAQAAESADSEEEVTLSLESLDLSSRVLHSLQEEGIDSVNALLALSERDLKKVRSEEHTSELQSRENLVCRL